MTRFERYVALGDSTTEGLQDPDGHGGYRGWANRFAEHLAAAQGCIHYANLAVRGLQVAEIQKQQLSSALAMKPDLATVVGGMNDLLRPRFDADRVAEHLRQMVAALTGRGATVLTFTMPDLTRVMPVARLLRGRLQALNARLRKTCAHTGALLIDLAANEQASDPRLWHEDRLHANPLGHQRIAMGLAHTVGLPGFEHWAQPLALPPRPTLRELARNELHWGRAHLLPWLLRHARGRSSSDGCAAKRPELSPLMG